jgi:hypothetical protein
LVSHGVSIAAVGVWNGGDDVCFAASRDGRVGGGACHLEWLEESAWAVSGFGRGLLRDVRFFWSLVCFCSERTCRWRLSAIQNNMPVEAAREVKRTIARSVVMGVGFTVIYVYGSVVSLRYLLRRVKDA